MSSMLELPALYLSQEHDCSYLPDLRARTLFANPESKIDTATYNIMLKHGFRRSGSLVYRSYCEGCSACIPVRVPVKQFKASRSQRRCWNKNKDLTIHITPAVFNDEHFALYQRYISLRHPDGSMVTHNEEDYMNFFVSPEIETCFVEIRHESQLIAVCIIDVLEDALSAVYTFFDPDAADRSPGVFSILWQIEQAKSQDLEWLYLGYWIEKCQKMNYKSAYRPIEYYNSPHWHIL
jgi:arginine-tRNA-protein transferase